MSVNFKPPYRHMYYIKSEKGEIEKIYEKNLLFSISIFHILTVHMFSSKMSLITY